MSHREQNMLHYQKALSCKLSTSRSDDEVVNSDSESNRSGANEQLQQSATNNAFDRSTYASLFSVIAETDKNYTVVCKLCHPAIKHLKTSKNSKSNLKKHLVRKHPESVGELPRLKRSRAACNCKDAPLDKKLKQMPFPLTPTTTSTTVDQAEVDYLLTEYIISSLQSLQIVEQEDFRALITGLAQGRTIMTRKTLTGRVENLAGNMTVKLSAALMDVRHICTTVDIWTSRNQSFLAVAAHWIDSQSLQRVSAALACRRVTGRHTWGAVAAALESVHTKFNIQDKVTLTVTDNLANFAKAFEVLGHQSDEEHPLPDAEAISKSEEDSETFEYDTASGDSADEREVNSDDQLTFVDIDALLLFSESDDADQQYAMPHQRCASHTMILAIQDSEDATEAYRLAKQGALSKCRTLWERAKVSTRAAQAIKDKLGCTLTLPNATSWHSTFNVLQQLQSIIANSELMLNELCKQLHLQLQFQPGDVTFIKEYCKVWQPVAQALDVLQSETNCYMGILLPTLVTLKKKLKAVRNGLELSIMHSLLDSLLSGIDRRFDGYFLREDLTLASVTMPQFRLRWIENAEEKQKARALLQRSLEALVYVTTPAVANQNPNQNHYQLKEESNFFDFESDLDNECKRTAIAELDMYLADSSKNLLILDKYPNVKKLFLQYNTGLPSSTPVQRLFSLGGIVATPTRGRLSDVHFEMLLLLRANKQVF